jgi:hypothetical protein
MKYSAPQAVHSPMCMPQPSRPFRLTIILFTTMWSMRGVTDRTSTRESLAAAVNSAYLAQARRMMMVMPPGGDDRIGADAALTGSVSPVESRSLAPDYAIGFLVRG